MIDKYEEIFDAYKSFIETKSVYGAKVVKYNTHTQTYFPLINCLCNITDTDECTNDKIEYYKAFYFTTKIYTKDKNIIINNVSTKVSSQVINDELTKLTIQFFGDMLNMKITLCKPTPNLDNDILTKTIQCQCLIGNIRTNIIRR